MNSLGGGSSGNSGGGAIVQTISPQAYQTASAQAGMGITQAGQQYTSGVNNAIKQLQQQYNIAQGFQQPYSASGQQALYQMNYLLGLNPVNPGNAPEAPTLDSMLKNVTNAQAQDYINQNAGWSNQTDASGGKFITPTYSGYGTNQGDQGYDSLMAMAAQQAAGAQSQGFSGNANQVMAYGNGLETGGAGYGGVGPGNPASAFSYTNTPLVNQEAKLGVANQQLQQAMPGYQQQLQQYNSQNDLYNQYKTLGVATPETLQGIVAGQPGYQAELGQGLAALNNAGSAGNQLGSGRTLAALSQYGQNTMSKYYGSMLSNLANLAGMGQQSANVQSGLSSNLGNTIGSLTAGLGTNLGNASIAQGNNLAQSAIGQGTQYQTMGGNSGGSNNSGLGSLLGGAASLLGSSATGGTGLMGLFG